TLLFITFFAFSLVLIVFLIYTFLSTMWIAWVLYHFMSWIGPRIRRPIVRRLRPAVTPRRVAYSFFLFLWMAVLLLASQRTTITWTMIEYTIATGFIMSCVIILHRFQAKATDYSCSLHFWVCPYLCFSCLSVRQASLAPYSTVQ